MQYWIILDRHDVDHITRGLIMEITKQDKVNGVPRELLVSELTRLASLGKHYRRHGDTEMANNILDTVRLLSQATGVKWDELIF